MIKTPWLPQRRSIDYGRLNAVVNAVVRRLYYWVFGAPEELRHTNAVRRFYEQYRKFQLNSWNFRELTFCVFLDQYYGQGCPDGPMQWNGGLKKIPAIGLSFWEARLPRIGFMYAMLAAFAGLLMSIQGLARTRNELDHLDLHFWYGTWCAVHFEYSFEGFCKGAAVFPRLDGYPVKWSAELKSEYANRKPAFRSSN